MVSNKELYNQEVIPAPDPVSPGHINDWRSSIRYGMTPFIDSLGMTLEKD